jgi:rhodanese-related sulfurtransferase
MPPAAKITKRSTMQEVLAAYPSAQRALFHRYHIGGCQSCGYQPGDVLEEVAQRHNITDVDGILESIEYAEQVDRRLEVNPSDVAAALQGSVPPLLIDVRTAQEWAVSRIDGSTLITEELAAEMRHWPKDVSIVFICHHGQRSLDAATYFAGHGYENVRSMTGGIDAWSRDVDSSVPRYGVKPEVGSGRDPTRPLRHVVSQAAGCQK